MGLRTREFYPVLRSEIDEIVATAIGMGATGASMIVGIIALGFHQYGLALYVLPVSLAAFASLVIACLRVLRRINRETYFEGREAFRQEP